MIGKCTKRSAKSLVEEARKQTDVQPSKKINLFVRAEKKITYDFCGI